MREPNKRPPLRGGADGGRKWEGKREKERERKGRGENDLLMLQRSWLRVRHAYRPLHPIPLVFHRLIGVFGQTSVYWAELNGKHH